MGRWLLYLGLLPVFVASTADPTPHPFPAEKAAKALVLPEGFTATVFAAEPDVVQPISFCTDSRGRLWVAEALNYGEWQPKGKDRIVILEDRDGDGRADSRTLFHEGFNYITGIEVGFGGVWVMSPPNLYFIPDRDRDDKPDADPTVLLDGFGYKESRHNLVNGFTWGPDGWLYGGHGRTSPSDVGTPGTPAAKRVHCDGGVYRIHATTLTFENFADGTTNPWGVDFNDYGQCFVSNCVNPHLFHMVQGGHYEPWRNRPSSLYAYERLPTIADHLHYPGGDLRKTLGSSETLSMGGGHAHCGTLIYLGDAFPARYRNSVFMCNVHGRRINNDLLKRKGSGYVASHGVDFMLAGDPWFMGVTLRGGPAGSIFVSDWSDTGECHTYKPDRATGRIYRIHFGPKKKVGPDLHLLDDAELVQLQLHPNDWHVRQARLILQERTGERSAKQQALINEQLIQVLAQNGNITRRLRALWALQAMGTLKVDLLQKLLEDPDEYLRAWAIQFLCEAKSPQQFILSKFAKLAQNDPSLLVRLYLASALQRIPLESRWPIAANLIAHAADATDANLPLMYWYAIEPLVSFDANKALALTKLCQIPKVRQFIARRFADAAAAKGDRGDLLPLIHILEDHEFTFSGDIIVGMREGLRGRKSFKMPEGWPAVYARLNQSDSVQVRADATALALVFQDPQAVVVLKTVVANRSEPAPQRNAALQLLIDHRVAGLAPTLHGLLQEPSLRVTALRGLGVYPHLLTAEKVLSQFAQWELNEKQQAVAMLGSRVDTALALLAAVEEKVVPRGDISAYAARQMFALNNPKLTERLLRAWGDIRESSPQKQEQLAKYRKLLTPTLLKSADLANGRLLYSKTCQQCHKLFGEGGTVGPDLTGANRTNLDYLLSNVIDPSAEVGRDYRMAVIRTQDARVITGIILERSPNRVLIQTDTDRVLLSPDDLESIKDSALSIMPEGQLDTLTPDQIRDLLGYIGAKSQVPLRDTPPSKK